MQHVPPLRVLVNVGTVDRSDKRITLPLESFYAILRAASAFATLLMIAASRAKGTAKPAAAPKRLRR
jgi:hypothetical protein